MKKTKLLIPALLISIFGFSQETFTDTTSIPNKDTTLSTPAITNTITTPIKKDTVKKTIVETQSQESKSNFKTGWSGGINLYQIAPGINVGKKLVEGKLSARIGFNSLVYDLPQSILDSISDVDTIKVGGNLSIGRGYIAFDYQPKKNGLFSLVAGVQYNDFGGQLGFGLTKDHVIDTVISQGGGSINAKVTIRKEQIGTIRVKIESAKFAPFIGWSLGRTVPNKRIGFRFETGLVFQGAMKATLEQKDINTGFQNPDGNDIIYSIGDPNNEDEVNKEIIKQVEDVNDQLKSFTFLPYISFSLNYKIN